MDSIWSCQSETTSLITHYRVDSSPSLKELDKLLHAFWDLEALGVIDSEESLQEQFSLNLFFTNNRYE